MQLTSIYFNNLKMLLKLTIILFINLSICIKNSSTATPEINYECTPERYVKIQNKTLVRDHRLKVLKKNGEACDLNNITINTCGVKQGEPVSLLLQEDNTTEVVGGHNSFKFQLNCTDEGVYTVISSSEIEVKPPTTLIPLKRPAYHAISLSILDSSNAPITGAVHVGQELKMIMEITDGSYVLGPKLCTAKGTHSESYKIWDISQSCFHDSSIIADKWTTVAAHAQRKLEILMYGFYFPNSTHVTIECLTHVCTNTTIPQCKNDCITVQRRRRRDTAMSTNDIFSHVKSVQVAFDVAVDNADVNSAIGILSQKPVYALMGITMYFGMQFL